MLLGGFVVVFSRGTMSALLSLCRWRIWRDGEDVDGVRERWRNAVDAHEGVSRDKFGKLIDGILGLKWIWVIWIGY